MVAGGVKGETDFATTGSLGSVGVTGKGSGGGGGKEGAGAAAPATRLRSIPSAATRSVTEPLAVLVNGRSASASVGRCRLSQ